MEGGQGLPFFSSYSCRALLPTAPSKLAPHPRGTSIPMHPTAWQSWCFYRSLWLAEEPWAAGRGSWQPVSRGGRPHRCFSSWQLAAVSCCAAARCGFWTWHGTAVVSGSGGKQSGAFRPVTKEQTLDTALWSWAETFASYPWIGISGGLVPIPVLHLFVAPSQPWRKRCREWRRQLK